MIILSLLFLTIINGSESAILTTKDLSRIFSSGFFDNGFGSYYMVTDSLATCNSTKGANLATMDIIMTRNNLTTVISGNVTFLKNVKFTDALIDISAWKSGRFNTIYKLFTHNPCKNPLLNSIMKLVIDNLSNCIAAKGAYAIKNLDLDKIWHGFTSKFFYGKIRTNVEWYQKHNCIICATGQVRALPPK